MSEREDDLTLALMELTVVASTLVNAIHGTTDQFDEERGAVEDQIVTALALLERMMRPRRQA